jgi:hypothetical protein
MKIRKSYIKNTVLIIVFGLLTWNFTMFCKREATTVHSIQKHQEYQLLNLTLKLDSLQSAFDSSKIENSQKAKLLNHKIHSLQWQIKDLKKSN